MCPTKFTLSRLSFHVYNLAHQGFHVVYKLRISFPELSALLTYYDPVTTLFMSSQAFISGGGDNDVYIVLVRTGEQGVLQRDRLVVNPKTPKL